VTIVSAMALSVLVALILTPALCATLLRSRNRATADARRGPLVWFNRGFNWTNRHYGRGVGRMIARSRWSLLEFAVITAAAVLMFGRIPTGFLPDEDQALLYGQVTLPPGATAEQTDAVNKRVVDYLLTQEKDGVDSVLSVVGYNFAGRAQNTGFFAIKLKDWSQRPSASQGAAAVAARTTQHFRGDQDARIIVFNMPAVPELGNATGFDLELEDRGQLGHERLLAARNQLLGMAAQDRSLVGVRPNGLEDAPQYHLEIDREKANALGVSVSDLDTTIQGALGSEFANLFLRNGRTKQVYVQGEADSRMLPTDLSRWYVRNASGDMVPFDAFLRGSWTLGPQKVETYNELPSFEILGAPTPLSSTGAAMATMEQLIAKLPPDGMSEELEPTAQPRQTGRTPPGSPRHCPCGSRQSS
jgi:multidrug efflux pump